MNPAPTVGRRGAIVLAGGASKRLGRPKALVRIGGTPIVARVFIAASAAADDVVVASRGRLAADVARVLPAGARIVRDRLRARTPLAGILAGAEALDDATVAVLACDHPFLEPRLLDRLFRTARGADAAIPRWPDGRIEPLVAVYRRNALARALRSSLAAGERSNQEMVRRLRDVRLVPTDALRPSDTGLLSFVNVNTLADLARARRLARPTSPPGARPRRR